ncbi:Zinc-binding dehydrogenase [compost metagenome]
MGTAAIQLAKRLGYAKVIVTAGSNEKLALCKELVADYWEQNLASIRTGGRRDYH